MIKDCAEGVLLALVRAFRLCAPTLTLSRALGATALLDVVEQIGL
jgi:hypothetical protein